MSIYYIKLKTGEELLGSYDVETDVSDETPMVYVNNIITFETNTETGTSLAKYWITYSEQKGLNISLDDVYFFGLANKSAQEFHGKFMAAQENIDDDEEADEVSAVEKIDGMTDEDIENYFDPAKIVH